MKKSLSLIIVLLLLLFCPSSYAAQSFETGWTESIDQGNIVFTPSGTTLSISATDDKAGDWGFGYYYKNFQADHGAIATFNIASTISSSHEGGNIGIRKYVAKNMSGNRILAELYLEYWDGKYSIRYRIRERAPSPSSTTIQTLARGVFGDWNGTWTTGENIQLGISFKNNTVYFYCDKVPGQYIKIDLFDTVSEIDSSTWIYTYVQGNSSIIGTVSALEVWNVTTYITHITSNSTWTDYLQVDNNSAFDASYTITLYNAAGTQVYSGSHDVSAGSDATLQPKVLSATARCGTITSTNKDLFFRYSYEHDSGGVAEFKLNSGFRNIYTQAGFYFNSTTDIVTWKGLAIANYSSTTTNITLYAYGASGLLGTATDTIPGNGKLVGVHTKWFPSVTISDLKRIIVVASNNLSSIDGIVICGDSTNSGLLFTNAADASGFVIPSP